MEFTDDANTNVALKPNSHGDAIHARAKPIRNMCSILTPDVPIRDYDLWMPQVGTAGMDHAGGPNPKTLSFETGGGMAVALTEQDSP